ncbi:hypothetical protein STAS_26564 [Striga asiatica]|uniref:Uncharacterized protein n=1 Tax=Striga asiatica TaxID=4170 RepID=A0A5A7QVU0_STRAF|nr:hypothetical protein STAS_26564 [Striga asiatica]
MDLVFILSQKNIQESEFPMPRELTSHVGARPRDISAVEDRKTFVKPSPREMPPPPPKSLSPTSRPPKFNLAPKVHGDQNGTHASKSEVVPDTLTKLMEYGDDDDDDDDDDKIEKTAKVPSQNHSSSSVMPKPFWAV